MANLLEQALDLIVGVVEGLGGTVFTSAGSILDIVKGIIK